MARETRHSLHLAVVFVLAISTPATVLASSISGTVTYYGEFLGTDLVCLGAHTAKNGPPSATAELASPGGAYSLDGLSDGSYYLSAYLEIDGACAWPPAILEPLAWYDSTNNGFADAVTVSGGDQTGKDLDVGQIYVDADAVGGNDGTTWADARTDLQAAIDSAPSGVQVWVAEGTYKPAGGSPIRRSHFQLKNGVGVIGGFGGTERLRMPNPYLHETVLSGDIGVVGDPTDNAYNVLVSGYQNHNSTAALAMVTVSDGYADGAIPYYYGAGFQGQLGSLNDGGPTLLGVTFRDNYAAVRGAGLLGGAGLTVINCRFFGNRSDGNGGGYFASGADRVINGVFSGNSAGLQGGAVYLNTGAALWNATVHNNSSDDEAGGIYANNAVVRNAISWHNTDADPATTVLQANLMTEGSVNVEYSLVEGASVLPGSGNRNEDPLFVDPDGPDNDIHTPDDNNLNLQLTSPAIDTGEGWILPDTWDIDRDLDTVEGVPYETNFTARFKDVPSVFNTGNHTPDYIDLGSYEAGDSPADLSITKDDGVTEVSIGDTVNYTITAANAGPDTAFYAPVADTFPPELSSCTWTCVGNGGASCTPGPMNGDINDLVVLFPGTFVTYTAVCEVDSAATGSVVNTATITSPPGSWDPDTEDQTATDTDSLVVVADVGVGMSTSPEEYVAAGEQLKYWVSAGSYGPSPVTGVVLADSFPVELNGCTWSCIEAGGGATCVAGDHSGDLLDTIDLPSDSWVVYSVVCTVDAAAVGSFMNTATITLPAGVSDPDVDDHIATQTHTIVPLHLDLEGERVTGDATYVAAQDIVVGSFVIEAPDGRATMRAGEQVVFGDGLVVEPGCELTVEIDPALAP